MRGRFVVFEGIEASGKSTQAARLAERRGALLTHEPGGTEVGSTIRGLLLRPDGPALDVRTEALLMAADRAQHVAQVVRPALEGGRDVVSDRHVGSSLAYQGVGRGLGLEPVASLSLFAVDGIAPDLVILVDVPVDVSRDRLGGDVDRFEQEDHEFHARVRAGYLELAALEPEVWVVVDGEGDVDAVTARVDQVVADRLGW